MRIEIITPTETLPPMEATAAELPAVTGRMFILKGHQPLVCALDAGHTMVESDGERNVWETGAGTMMLHNDVITLLVKSAKQL